MCWTRRWPLVFGAPLAALARWAAADATARTSAGSFTMSSATSSMARAASISSRAAACRCSTTSWAFSSRWSCDCVSLTGAPPSAAARDRARAHIGSLACARSLCASFLGDEGDLPPIPHHLCRGNGAPLEGIREHDAPPVRADAYEQFVLYAPQVEVVVVGERQLEGKHIVVAPLFDGKGLALVEHG